MREILFKAKRKNWRNMPKDEWWVEGCFVKGLWYFYEEETYAIIPTDAHFYPFYESSEFVEIDPETLCQFTGLTDKNGKRIWENDIVVCKKYLGGNFVDYCVEYGYVEMKHGAFGLHRIKQDSYYRPLKDWLEDYEYEVIGNIFDNKDLLEG